MDQIPARKDSFVRTVDVGGDAYQHIWLCQNAYRGNQLFAEMLALHDPFVKNGEITATRAWEGYGEYGWKQRTNGEDS
jgi:hypothetical protein